MPSDELRYGFVGMIVHNRNQAGARINQILADHSDCIVGRLGMPNLEEGRLAIITLIVHATTDRLGSLTGKLGSIADVSIKTGLHRPLNSTVAVPGASEPGVHDGR